MCVAPHLTTMSPAVLDMSGTRVTDAGLGWVSQACSGLRTLKLKDCFHITGSGLYMVGYGCPKLTEVDLTNCEQLTDNDFKLFGQGSSDKQDEMAAIRKAKLDAAHKVRCIPHRKCQWLVVHRDPFVAACTRGGGAYSRQKGCRSCRGTVSVLVWWKWHRISLSKAHARAMSGMRNTRSA